MLDSNFKSNFAWRRRGGLARRVALVAIIFWYMAFAAFAAADDLVFVRTVHPSFPDWTFTLTWRDGFLHEIRAKSPQTTDVQLLHRYGDTNIQRATYAERSDLLVTADWNFDGYLDLGILASEGSGGKLYDIWLFDLKTKRFIKNEELGGLWNLQAHLSTQTLTATNISAQGSPEVKTYAWRAGQLQPIDAAVVADFLQKRELCEHWLGEPFEETDPERQKEILSQIQTLCTGLDATLTGLKGRYPSDIRLTGLEPIGY